MDARIRKPAIVTLVLLETSTIGLLLKRYGEVLRASEAGARGKVHRDPFHPGDRVDLDVLLLIGDGGLTSLRDVVRQPRRLLCVLFLSSDCPSCLQLMQEIEAGKLLPGAMGSQESVLIVVPDDATRLRLAGVAEGRTDLLVALDSTAEIGEKLRVSRIPALICIDPEGIVTRPILEGYEAVKGYLLQWDRRTTHR